MTSHQNYQSSEWNTIKSIFQNMFQEEISKYITSETLESLHNLPAFIVQLGEWQGNLTTVFNTLAGTVTASDEEIKASQNTLTASVEEIKASQNTLTANVNTLADTVYTLTVSDEEIKASQNTLTANVNTLADTVYTLAGTVNTLTASVEEIKASQNTLTANVSTLTGTVNTLAGTVNTLDANVNSLRGDLDDLAGKVDEITEAQDILIDKVNILQKTGNNQMSRLLNFYLGRGGMNPNESYHPICNGEGRYPDPNTRGDNPLDEIISAEQIEGFDGGALKKYLEFYGFKAAHHISERKQQLFYIIGGNKEKLNPN